MKVLYFAWVREKTKVGEEMLAPPASVRTVADLVGWLKSRGNGFADAFADVSMVRAAVNQEHVPFNHPVKAGDEIAFFPPVTGG
jgi:molybdopterin synthase sulfur carrier subunit